MESVLYWGKSRFLDKLWRKAIGHKEPLAAIATTMTNAGLGRQKCRLPTG